MSSLDKPIPPNSTLATTASSNQSGSNDFVKKLFLMLQEDGYKDVVRWTQSGDSFVVINTNNFTKNILPRHFKHSNFASFVRQLNKYDFHKVKIPNEAKSTYPYGEDAWEFKHPDFKMNDPVSLENIKRKGPSTKKNNKEVPNGTKPKPKAPATVIKQEEKEGSVSEAAEASATTEGNYGQYDEKFSQLTSGQSKLKEQINQVKDTNQMLNQEINILQRKYQTLVEHIVSINSSNERYYRSIGSLVNSLVQAGIKVPPLDLPLPSSGPYQLQEPNNSFPIGSSSIPGSTLPSISQHLQSQSPRVNNIQSPLIPPAQINSPRLPIPQTTAATNVQSSLSSLNNRALSIPGGRPLPNSFNATSPISGLASLSRSSSIHQLPQPSFPQSDTNDLRTSFHKHTKSNNTPSSDGNVLNANPEQSSGSIDNNNRLPTSSEYVNPSPSNKPISPMTSTSASPSGNVLPQISTTSIPNPKFHVLLVEDDNVCIQLCRKFLVKYGCQVTVVTDGLNAISTVESTKYDLVLMDIVMPNLDGATATSVIRSFDTRTPIIAMTGNIEDNDLVTYLQNGMSDILAKPFTKDDLYSILAKHLLKEEKLEEEPSSKKQRVE
ncbi:SKN7 [Candida metapsilosis]|uniref:Transcription factor n=1 Tax=Candida metapsilosis TaxID=273372 RepID=A0A8H8DB91_9ASCO|nr:SKN7 [Candida metapsilosis]